MGNSPNVVLGFAGINGVHTRMIGFYRESGLIGESMTFSSFKRTIGKIRKHHASNH